MFRTLTLLCVVTAPVFGAWEPNLRVKFSVNVFTYGSESFKEMPKDIITASSNGWVQKTRPGSPSGLESLVMWCPSTDYTVCILYDDTGYVAGLQIALDKSKFTKAVYDWTTQGFTSWTTTFNNETVTYYTTQQYYISPEILATDPATRIANRDSSKLLQFSNIWLSGFYGELFNISTNYTVLTSEDSGFTKQGCFPWMGRHYYYNMTETTECRDDTLFPWFPITYGDEITGLGFTIFGNYEDTDYFEFSDRTVVEINVPHAPECVYELADSPGVITLHTYFIDKPLLITCLVGE